MTWRARKTKRNTKLPRTKGGLGHKCFVKACNQAKVESYQEAGRMKILRSTELYIKQIKYWPVPPFQLQLERLGGLFLDLFHARNPPVVSLCPQQHWLYGYSQNASRQKSCLTEVGVGEKNRK